MKEKLQKFLFGAYQPFTIYAAVMIFYHSMMKENPILDTLRYFAVALNQYNLIDYLQMRYETWTSRIFIEPVIVILARHLTVWKVLDIIVLTLIPVTLSLLFGCLQSRKYNWLIVGLCLLYPLQDMGSTGWASTCTFYTWVLAFGLLALVPTSKAIKGKELRWYDFAIGVVPLIYAANMEQMCALLTVTFAGAIIYICWKQKSELRADGLVEENAVKKQSQEQEETACSKENGQWLLVAQLLICLLQLANIALCPGNSVRTQAELTDGISNYQMLGMLDKLYLGFNDTIQKLIDDNLVLVAFTLFMFLLITVKHKKISYSIIAAVPVFYAVRENVLGTFFQNFLSYLGTNYQMTVETYMNGTGYLMLFFQVVFVLCIVLEIVILSDTYGEWIFMTLVLGGGFVSRVIMGFSPTLYSSGNRTFLYLYFCMIFAVIYYVKKNGELLAEYRKAKYVMAVGLGLFACVNVMNVAAYIMLWD